MWRIRRLAAAARESLWFLPLTLVICAIALAVGLIELGLVLGPDWVKWPLMLGAGAEGSRAMLTAIATSMITVAGLTFSLTMVAMAQVASQFTSRVLRHFIRDRRNQATLGVFVGVFAYCLVVLRTIRGPDEGGFVPTVAVFVGLILALGSILVLIAFIHHLASSLQATTILARAAEETRTAIHRVFPEERPPGLDERRRVEAQAGTWHPVPAPAPGFVQDVDLEGLVRLARRRDLEVRVERSVGSFVTEGTVVLSTSRPVEDAHARELAAQVSLGSHRTVGEDVGFGIQQLSDVALKALSPAINDMTTAIISIHHLGAVLHTLVARFPGDGVIRHHGAVRVLHRQDGFEELVDAPLAAIRRAAEGQPDVMRALLGVLQRAGERCGDPDRRRVLARHLEATRTMVSSAAA